MEDMFAEDVLLSSEKHRTFSSNACSTLNSTPKFETNMEPAQVGINVQDKFPTKKKFKDN